MEAFTNNLARPQDWQTEEESEDRRSEEESEDQHNEAAEEYDEYRSTRDCLVFFTDAAVQVGSPSRYTGISVVFAREDGGYSNLAMIAPPP